MGKEIERKFLVGNDNFIQQAVEVKDIYQAYLSTDPDATVRIRISGSKAWLTVKTRNHGIERGEWEYEIPADDARDILAQSNCPHIHKMRYIVPAGEGLVWEVDRFLTPDCGLTVAEIELPTIDSQFPRPEWLGTEVTGDPQYYNSMIIKRCAGR